MTAKKTGWSNISRHKRGYGNSWDKLRLVILKRDNGLCQCNECQGGKLRLTIANEVHHIKPKANGGTDDMSNLQSINKECHKRETAAQQGRKLMERQTIDETGWPV